MLRVFATFLKKGSAKNFLAERFLGVLQKRTENVKFSVLFAVGTNCVRPRAFRERPYVFDFFGR